MEGDQTIMADPDDQQTEVAHPEMKNGAAMTEDAAHADTPVAGPSDTKGTTPVDAASTFTMETEEGLLLASTTDDVQDAEKGAKEVSSTERNVDEGVKGNGRDAEEEKKEQSKKPAEGDEFSDDESYHSPGEEEYKSESDGASGLLRGRRREASDEEDEDEDDEDAISVTHEVEVRKGLGAAASGEPLKLFACDSCACPESKFDATCVCSMLSMCSPLAFWFHKMKPSRFPQNWTSSSMMHQTHHAATFWQFSGRSGAQWKEWCSCRLHALTLAFFCGQFKC